MFRVGTYYTKDRIKRGVQERAASRGCQRLQGAKDIGGGVLQPVPLEERGRLRTLAGVGVGRSPRHLQGLHQGGVQRQFLLQGFGQQVPY